MVDQKPRYRIQATSSATSTALPQTNGVATGVGRKKSFEAGRQSRRLKGLTSVTQEINRQIRTYGRTVLARSRYLATNNSYAAQAKEVFVSALIGSGIKPSSLIANANLKQEIQEHWLDWTDEADSDGQTDFYGLQALCASEMFEAGECFVRIRARRPEDGLTVPFQLQVIPAEMLPTDDNRDLGNGRRVQMGVEFDAIGRRVAYHFLRQHPAADKTFSSIGSETVRVPASDVIHLFKPVNNAGQIRGIPHTLSAIVTAAVLDAYDDAELERKRIAALFGGFITKPSSEDGTHPLSEGIEEATDAGNSAAVAMEPGMLLDLDEGQDVTFAEPADVGGSYEAFQYRNLLRMAAGFGVPYAAMTGDLRQTTYGSIRAGLIEFRRRIEAMQHSVMVFQFCRPLWIRFMDELVLAGSVSIPAGDYVTRPKPFRRVKWIPPRWEWIDPLKDRQAELLAVKAGFKARSDVVEAEGSDPEETDARIAADRKREKSLGLDFTESQFAASSIGNQNDGENNGA